MSKLADGEETVRSNVGDHVGATSLKDAAATLAEEFGLFLRDSDVPRLDLSSPSSLLRFTRDFVGAGKPCVLVGAQDDWGATLHLARLSQIGDVSVAMTPNGRADDIEGAFFAKPHVAKMKFAAFAAMLEGGVAETASAVPYLSSQNNVVEREFKSLLGKEIPDLKRAEGPGGRLRGLLPAFGDVSPDQCNLWVSDKRSRTSMHIDYYHNLYAVVKGVKEWTLLPPFARALLEEKTYVAARWRCNDEGSWSGPWSLQVDEAEKQEHKLTRWITEPKDMKAGREKAALTGLTTVLRLEAGEVLYLPPLWYHAVQTRGDEIAVAVNWMLDMRFDDRFCFHKLVETT